MYVYVCNITLGIPWLTWFPHSFDQKMVATIKCKHVSPQEPQPYIAYIPSMEGLICSRRNYAGNTMRNNNIQQQQPKKTTPSNRTVRTPKAPSHSKILEQDVLGDPSCPSFYEAISLYYGTL